MNITEFGKIGNETVKKYTIGTDDIKVSVLDYGATICEIYTKDKNGQMGDIVCGYDNIESYVSESGYLGATVGRYANRISNGKFNINGKEYTLATNNGTAHIHGGNVGFDKKIWKCEGIDDTTVIFSATSPDGEEGYPGNVELKVTFSIVDNALLIAYFAATDAPTYINLTNHSYFNLNGFDSGTTILNHKLYINADRYDVVDDALIPIGMPASVENTDFDFRKSRTIGKNYDHNFIINGSDLRTAAILEGDISGRTIEVVTDMPAIQIYTSANFSGKPMKNNAPKINSGAVCLETQFSPDTPNRPYMPQCLYDRNNSFISFTKFIFGVNKE